MRIERVDAPTDHQAHDGIGADLINRDLSDLAFVQRVLEEAENGRNPVLERARFLAITGMLLDEFYRIRVAALREQIRLGTTKPSRDGVKPSKQLKRADKYSNRLIVRQDRCWRRLQRDLRRAEISLVMAAETSANERAWLADRFRDSIRPKLAPAIGEISAALESIRNGSLLVFAELAPGEAGGDTVEAVVPIPPDLPRFVALPGDGYRVVPIEEIIKLCLEDLFGGMRVEASGLARVLREGSLRPGDGDDLLRLVRDAIEKRERADVIRLRVERSMPERLARVLAARLGLLRPEEIKALEKSRRRATTSEFVVADAFLGLPDLIELIDGLPAGVAVGLRFPRLEPSEPEFVSEFGGDLFRAIAAEERMLHFPFDDFDVLVRLVECAAADDAVVGIKQTLYRTGRNSPVVHALAEAARSGKRVEVVVELEAREDEASNVELATLLESAGASVHYGVRELKVHAKILIIDRLEGGATRSYVHCSSGNYSMTAGRAYTDVCLLSSDPKLGREAGRLFESIRDGETPESFERIVVAPLGLRQRLIDLIRTEIRNAERGLPSGIWLKLNKLSDEAIIRELYRASEAGVAIRIVVRGICCLRSGVPGLSQNIHVKSVVGRYLEHSRLFCFARGNRLPSESAAVFLSSADLMTHKLDRRVEALVAIEDPKLKRAVQHGIFEPYFADQASSWVLQPDDRWIRSSRVGFSVHSELGAAHDGVEPRAVLPRREAIP